MTEISGIDPSTGEELAAVAAETTSEEVAGCVMAAAGQALRLTGMPREVRATLLEHIADAIDENAEQLVETAVAETGFTTTKLTGEVARASYQFRFFAEVVREGSFLEAAIDHAGRTPAGPRPDLRRILVPLGTVAVFGASNFPFAFSVLGGDTASALAAGNPVVVKAHASHPATSVLSHRVLLQGLTRAEVPAEAIGIVHGLQAGVDLVTHPEVKAVGFTGSLAGGQALLEAIGTRDEPVPFYGELSSLNPVIVTPAAAADRPGEIGKAFADSLTMGAGQLCTKPGLLLVPTGPDGDDVVSQAAKAVADGPDHVLLNAGIHRTFNQQTQRLSSSRAVTIRAGGAVRPGPGFHADGTLLEVDLDDLDHDLLHEVFGPISLVVRYQPDALQRSVRELLDLMPASLTVSFHIADEDGDGVANLTALAVARSGRVVFNGFPTGVAVSWAQTHGGPWPATNSVFTSVGASAIRRFLRPVTFQNAPVSALPIELRDDFGEIPRRVDGVLTTS